MIRVETRPFDQADVDHVASRLRAADRDECEALGHSGDRAVRRAVDLSFETEAGVIQGRTVCLFGIGLPMLFGHIARPWMLGTDDLSRHPLAFLRGSRPIVANWAARYAVLENYVDARNTVSIAWLKWLGFHFDDALPFGPMGFPFHKFSMRR